MWDYSQISQPTPYWSDDTYRKGVAFLDGPGVLEDWGCGTTYAKQFVRHATYVGVDSSPSAFNDVVADLTTYTSQADFILLRHVLEHSYKWEDILQNAINSAKYRLCIILFTPLAPTTTEIVFHKEIGVPDLSLNETSFRQHISTRRMVAEEVWGYEKIFYLA